MIFRILKESSLLPISYPPIFALPLVFDIRQQSIRMVVVFPAPFGPRKPKTSPSSTCRLRSSTAVKAPNFFVRFSTSIKLGHRGTWDTQAMFSVYLKVLVVFGLVFSLGKDVLRKRIFRYTSDSIKKSQNMQLIENKQVTLVFRFLGTWQKEVSPIH